MYSRGEIRHIKVQTFERRERQHKNIWKLGNSYSGQVKLEGGERKAEKTEKTTEEKEEDEEE